MMNLYNVNPVEERFAMFDNVHSPNGKIPKGKSGAVNRKGACQQWPNEKEQQDKQRSTKHNTENWDWETRTPLKPEMT